MLKVKGQNLILYNIKNIILQDLANCLGISKTQISNILSDRFVPIKSNIIQLAEFLEVSPLEIIKEKNIKKEDIG